MYRNNAFYPDNMFSLKDKFNRTMHIFLQPFTLDFPFLYVIHRHCNKFLSLALICLRTVEYPSKEFKSRVMRFNTYYRATHIFTQLFGMKKLKQWDKLSHCPFEWLYPWVWVRASWRRPLLTLVLCVSFEFQIVSGD